MPGVTYPNLGLIAGFDVGENGWGDEMTANMKLLSIVAQGSVIDKVAALPGAPVDGDVVILDETNLDNPNDIAAYIGAAWEYITPQDGWLIYNQTESYYEKFEAGVWAELATGGGALDDLTDVDTTTTPPTDGQALVWDDGLSLWVPGDVAAGGVDASATSIALTPLPAFQNGWVNNGAGFMELTVIKTGRIVTINGLLKDGIDNTTAFTLPVGWRPVAAITSAVHSGAGHGNVRVAADGQVNVQGSSVFTYVEISFVVPEADAFNGGEGYTSISTVVDAAYSVLGTEGYVIFDRATAQIVTLPAAIPVGFQISGRRQGAGSVTFAAGAGAVIKSADDLLACRVVNSAFTATKESATDWGLAGDLA